MQTCIIQISSSYHINEVQDLRNHQESLNFTHINKYTKCSKIKKNTSFLVNIKENVMQSNFGESHDKILNVWIIIFTSLIHILKLFNLFPGCLIAWLVGFTTCPTLKMITSKSLFLEPIIQFHIWFKQDGAISIEWSKPLKLIDQFIYGVSNILSTESGVNISMPKV